LLLFHIRFRLGLFVFLGAVATMLALGVDTFGQLVVDLSGYRTIETNDGQASFGLTHIYDSGVQTQFPELTGRGGDGLMPNSMHAPMSPTVVTLPNTC
jgi:hypothetical protein